MTDFLKELEALAALDERATPGKVELHTSCSWRRIIAERNRAFLVPTIDPDRHQNMDSVENAQFVVALVNWYRAHRAEITGMVRDQARMDWVEANAHALDWDPHEPMKRVIRGDDGAEFCGDTWREQIDAAIDGRHNGAQEGR